MHDPKGPRTAQKTFAGASRPLALINPVVFTPAKDTTPAASPAKIKFPDDLQIIAHKFENVRLRRELIKQFPHETLAFIAKALDDRYMTTVEHTLGNPLFVYEMLNAELIGTEKKPSPASDFLRDKAAVVRALLKIIDKTPQELAEKILVDNDGAECMITADPESARDVLAALEAKADKCALKALMAHEPFQNALYMAGIEPDSVARSVAKRNPKGPRGMD